MREEETTIFISEAEQIKLAPHKSNTNSRGDI